MTQIKNMLIAIPFILFVYAQILALYFLPQPIVLVHILVIGSMTLFMFLLKWKWSFLFIVVTTLLYGFILTGIAFLEKLQQQQQIDFIIMNIVYFVSIISIWHSAHHLQKSKMILEFEQLKTSELKKFVNENTNLLTNKEFTDRVALNLVALKRRNEMGYLMQISGHNPNPKNKENVFNIILTEVIENSTRDQFDYFTYMDSSTFLIYLQNTNEEGCRIVESRVLNQLSLQVNTIDYPVEFTSKRIEDLKDALLYFKVGSFI
ncbi:hypothetical protein [Paenisporosarcina sp. TG20]|uniref:hypothetical protein n=1 Tax=Paenisporosarcina sp. TG20 TaxID=1211706 RepID=UPI00035F3307|nr:hypothetical protein [Paenisporosarcina sp. TG20]